MAALSIQVALDTGSAGDAWATTRRAASVSPTRVEGLMKQIKLTSVTGGPPTADYTKMPNIKVGKASSSTAADRIRRRRAFRRFGPTNRPALLLGMDA